jgi:hypothetical protein
MVATHNYHFVLLLPTYSLKVYYEKSRGHDKYSGKIAKKQTTNNPNRKSRVFRDEVDIEGLGCEIMTRFKVVNIGYLLSVVSVRSGGALFLILGYNT